MLVFLIDVSVVLFALGLLRVYRSKNNTYKDIQSSPPGPRGYPLIGNVFDTGHANMWETARQWGRVYGPIVFVQSFGTPILFLNSYDVIVDLFEKRGSIYSSRPNSMMLDLNKWSSWFVALFPYGDNLKKSRQLLHRHLQLSVVPEYYPILESSTHKLLEGLLNTPDDFVEHVRNSAGRSILKIAYGYDISDKNDPYVKGAEEGIRLAAEASGFFLVNLLPWLQHIPPWLPGTYFLKLIRMGRELGQEMLNRPYARAKQEILDGVAINSLASKMIESAKIEEGSISGENTIKNVLGVTFGAGADTTVSVLTTFILAMVLHPEVLKRGQEELDRVIGKNRLPTIADQPNLPYIAAIQKECLRWQIVLPFAIAHILSEDDIYKGYFIPKGTIVYSNLWAALRDPNLYDKPDEFIPERWLPLPGEEPPLDSAKIGFGIGRRICSGRHLADKAVFIGIASILSAFNIKKAIGEDGIPITPKVEYVEEFARHPKPFKCVIKPRSQEITSEIRQTVEAEKL